MNENPENAKGVSAEEAARELADNIEWEFDEISEALQRAMSRLRNASSPNADIAYDLVNAAWSLVAEDREMSRRPDKVRDDSSALHEIARATELLRQVDPPKGDTSDKP